ncbi:hypothetical protein RRG08_053958 [Elysia crispata]|uniref:Uncharacterized protein n=1 Tax=Elysia crispata TaxID=231223 RepID=A0AAE0ZEQ3_9GAST|nr:hypothetical protein RRG08_053958 [Elysia crispata]
MRKYSTIAALERNADIQRARQIAQPPTRLNPLLTVCPIVNQFNKQGRTEPSGARIPGLIKQKIPLHRAPGRSTGSRFIGECLLPFMPWHPFPSLLDGLVIRQSPSTKCCLHTKPGESKALLEHEAQFSLITGAMLEPIVYCPFSS